MRVYSNYARRVSSRFEAAAHSDGRPDRLALRGKTANENRTHVYAVCRRSAGEQSSADVQDGCVVLCQSEFESKRQTHSLFSRLVLSFLVEEKRQDLVISRALDQAKRNRTQRGEQRRERGGGLNIE